MRGYTVFNKINLLPGGGIRKYVTDGGVVLPFVQPKEIKWSNQAIFTTKDIPFSE